MCVIYSFSRDIRHHLPGAVEEDNRDATQSIAAIRAGVAFALIGIALWLLTWI